jgi:competence protein ComGF
MLSDLTVQSEFLFFIEVIRAKLNRIDETLDQLKREGPAELNAKRDVASHMFSEIETNLKRKE